ncbi:type II toxin-antitoxin system YoeB family toxin [Candidatus Bipolaricaulota bacterium]|nr:type II toxin-antitoxin system YoeB family toxin [Candidatus Bipolaricaulota bacterium]
MKTLVWSPSFVRAFKRAVRRQPKLRMKIERTLHQVAKDPFHPMLHSHKLKGELAGAWACTVDYDNRILFEFVQNPESGEEEILLLTMGTHDEVY